MDPPSGSASLNLLRTYPRALFALALSCALAAPALAQTTTWTGLNDDSLWSSSYNWSNGTPTTSIPAIFATSGLATTVDAPFDIKGISLNSGDLTLNQSGSGSLKTESYVLDPSAGTLTFNIGLTGPGTLYVYGGGAVAFNAGGASTYSGYTNIYGSAGSLSDGAANAFSPNSVINIDGPGSIAVNYNETIAGLNDYSTGGASVVLASGATLTISGNATTSFSGVISGSGSLEKSGNSTLILKGTNTYTGPTVVDSGSSISLSGTAGALASSGVSGAGGITFARTNAYTYAGNLTGGLTVTESGGASGSTILSGTNTYTGATSILSGTLQAGSTQALGTQSAVTVASGATLSLGGYSNTIGSLAGAGTVSLAGGEALTLSNTGAQATFTGSITGTGSLVSGTYVAWFQSGNTYSGGTTITTGTLLADNTTGYATGTGPITVTGGALQIGNSYDSTGYVDPSSAITVTGAGKVSFARGDTTTFSNTIGGTGTIGQFGTGTVILSANNTYSGGTTVFRGTFRAGSTSAFGTGGITFGYGGTLDLNGFSNSVGWLSGTSGNTVTLGGATLTLTDNGATQTFSGVISGSGNLTLSGSGLTQVLDGANTYVGTTTIGAGATLSIGDQSATGAAIATPVVTNGTLEFQPSTTDETVFSNNISGTGSVLINGATSGSTYGSVTLSGNNTYSGGTTLASGELFVGSNTALGTGTATLYGGTEFSPTVAVVLGNPFVLTSTGMVDNEDGGANAMTLTGNISGTAGLMWCTTGVLTLSGANSFSGGLDLREGEFLAGSDTAAGTGILYLDTGTVFSAAGTGQQRTLSNAVELVGSSAQIGNSDSNTLTLTGPLSYTGAATLTYAGGAGGTLVLTGTNAGLTGSFVITSGKVVAGSNSALGASGDTVSLTGGAGLLIESGVTLPNALTFTGSGNTLGGNGTVSSGPLTAGSALIISPTASPGGGPGTLSFTQGLTFSTGSTLQLELENAGGTNAMSTDWSVLAANGGLTFSASPGTITLNLLTTDASGHPAAALNFNAGQSYSWLVATAPSITGFSAADFSIVTSGFMNSTAGGSFSIADVGNDLYLNFTPVPEPSDWALLASGVALTALAAVRRRIRARA